MPHAPMNQQYTSPKINQTLGVYTIDFTSVIVNYVVRRMNFFANGFAIILTFSHIFKETQAIHSPSGNNAYKAIPLFNYLCV